MSARHLMKLVKFYSANSMTRDIELFRNFSKTPQVRKGLKMLALIFLLFWINSCKSMLTIRESDMVAALAEHLDVAHCVLIRESPDWSIRTVKKLNEKKILAAYISPDQLMDYLDPSKGVLHSWGLAKPVPWKTLFVWKTDAKRLKSRIFNERQIHIGSLMSDFTWVVILESVNISSIIWGQIHVPYNCQFLIVDAVDGTAYRIHEFYQIKPHVAPIFKKFGTWDDTTGLDAVDPYFFGRRFNLGGVQMVMYAYTGKISYAQLPWERNLEIFEDMGKMMNYTTYAMTQYEAQFYGVLGTKISTYDAGMDPIPFFSGFANMRMMFGPILDFKVYMHVKYQNDELTGLGSLLKPFAGELWMTFAFWLVASTIVSTFVTFLSAKILSPESLSSFNFVNSLFVSLDHAVNQGVTDLLPNPSSRLAHLSLWVQAVVLVPLYTGAIVSFLTIRVPHLPFQDLDGFVQDGTYKMNALKNTALITYFKISDDPQMQFIAANKFLPSPEMAETLVTGIKRMCATKTTFLAFNNDLSILESPCTIMKIPKPIFKISSGIILKHLSSFAKILNDNLIKFRASGIIRKMQVDWEQTGTTDLVLKPQQQWFEPIEMQQVLPAIFFVAVGIVLGFLIFVCEYFVFKFRQLTFIKI